MSADLGFGDRVAATIAGTGRLCVGVDPHPHLLAAWGLGDDAASAREFGLRVVAAAAESAGFVKPQVAFFERYGAAGYAALERVLAEARAAGLVTIADAKRGDVGTSVAAYARAWLEPGSPLEADAVTVSAFQGVGSLAEPLRLAVDTGKGLFVLAATSNPEAAAIQRARVGGPGDPTVSRAIVEEVLAFNARNPAADLGPIGVVLGATLDLAAAGIDTSVRPRPGLPVLAPGFGHQGALVADAATIYGELYPDIIITESRSLLEAGGEGLGRAIAARAEEVNALRG